MRQTRRDKIKHDKRNGKRVRERKGEHLCGAEWMLANKTENRERR